MTLKNIMYSLFGQKEEEIQSIDGPSEERDIFFANMSHELRTPVNGIVGFTQLLKDTKLSEEQDELVNTIHSSSMHLLQLVNDILDFTKINSNKLELEEIPFNLFRQIEDTIETHALIASEKDVELGLCIDPTLPLELLGDPTKISQVMINLVGNAIKFTDSYGTVNIYVKKVEENSDTVQVKFSIMDTGIGIDPNQIERIFNPFLQADASTSRKFGGSGLGLPISSKLVTLMGGELNIESKVDEGSSFYFTLTFTKEDKEKIAVEANQYTGLRIGLLLPHKEVNREIDLFLKKYVEHLGATFKIYYHDEIFTLDESQIPDILFVDQRYTRIGNEIELFLGLKTNIILMTTSTIKKDYSIDTKRVQKILYKPINLTKTLKALETCVSPVQEQQEDLGFEEKFNGLRILVAEDNPVNQKLMERIFERLDITVISVNNGEKALQQIQKNHFNMIFMDIQMPVMDGFTACRAIHAYEVQAKIPHTPIIALTGNNIEKDEYKYKEAGMDAWMTKPLDMKILVSLIKKYKNTNHISHNDFAHIDEKVTQYTGTKALIVENNPTNQNLIGRVLASLDIETKMAVNGSIGFQNYQEESFDIIFMGTDMPIMDGIEASQKMRAYEEDHFLEHTPIIALLPDSVTDEEKIAYTYMRADDVIYKPLNIDEIKFQAERYLEHKKVETPILCIETEFLENKELDVSNDFTEIPIEGNNVEKLEEVEEDISISESNFSQEMKEGKKEVSIPKVERKREDTPQKTSQYEIKYIDVPLNREK